MGKRYSNGDLKQERKSATAPLSAREKYRRASRTIDLTGDDFDNQQHAAGGDDMSDVVVLMVGAELVTINNDEDFINQQVFHDLSDGAVVGAELVTTINNNEGFVSQQVGHDLPHGAVVGAELVVTVNQQQMGGVVLVVGAELGTVNNEDFN